MAPNTLGNWIDGGSLPPKTRIPSLAAALRISPRSLLKLVDAERQERRALAEQRQDSDVGAELVAVDMEGVHGDQFTGQGHDIADQIGQTGGQQ